VCTACGAERKPKNILYDKDTVLPYCHTPFICNDAHPNSVENLKKTGRYVEMVEAADAEKIFNDKLLKEYGDPETSKMIKRLLSSPVSFRVQTEEQAKFIAALIAGGGAEGIAEAIRYCIDKVMNGGTAPELPEITEQPTEAAPVQPQPQEDDPQPKPAEDAEWTV
jgi:ribosomal protein S9